MNLIEQLNNSNFDFYFLVVDQFLDIDLPQLTNFYSVSAKKLGITLDVKNSGKLLSHPKVLEYINKNSTSTGRKPAIIPFKPSAKIDFICQQNSWILVGNPSPLNRYYEDKIKFFDLCTQYCLPIVPALVLPFNQENYQIAHDKFDQDLVLQTHFGWAGNSSYISQQWSDVESKIPLNTIVKFSPYLLGYSLINNCCLISGQLIQSPPGLQYTGIKPLTQNPLATVGRQWPSFTPKIINDQVKLITQQFSDILNRSNYRGFFGLDFLISKNKVYLLECNPRLTASFAFYTTLELNQNITPLFLLHLAEFVNMSYSEPDHFNTEIVGSQITSKSSSGATTNKYQDTIPFATDPNKITFDPEIINHVL